MSSTSVNPRWERNGPWDWARAEKEEWEWEEATATATDGEWDDEGTEKEEEEKKEDEINERKEAGRYDLTEDERELQNRCIYLMRKTNSYR